MEDWLVDGLNWLTRWVTRLTRRRPDATIRWVIGTEVERGTGASAPFVALTESELDRHLYLLGASGSGKSRLLELLIRQQIQQGSGFCLVDPHGDLTGSILAFLYEELQAAKPPIDPARVILVEPFREDGIVGLNPLDPNGGPLHPHIGELIGIFRRFWASSWGPRMEELLRTTLLTLALAKLTLVEAIPLLTQPEFRSRIVEGIEDEAVRGYWQHRYDPLSDAARASISEPVLNKLGALLADPRVRAMLGQRTNCLNLRRLMDEGGWLLVNCARGQLRDASYLLGSFLVAQLQSAALSRGDVPESARRPFTVFVDEFQHFRGEDFESILCEARKFRLRLVMAHQHLGQMDPGLQNAVFGNVATQVFFSLSPQDATVAGKRMDEGTMLVHQLMHQPVGHAMVCRRGQPPVFTKVLHVANPGTTGRTLAAFAASLRERHGISRRDAELEIRTRVMAPAASTAPALAASPTAALSTAGRKRRGRKGETPPASPPTPPAPPSARGSVREASDD